MGKWPENGDVEAGGGGGRERFYDRGMGLV